MFLLRKLKILMIIQMKNIKLNLKVRKKKEVSKTKRKEEKIIRKAKFKFILK